MQMQSRRAQKTMLTKEKILSAADELFTTEGYEAITFRSLAAKSGISFGSIQHHYGTKDNLMYVYGCGRFEKYMQEEFAPSVPNHKANAQVHLIHRMNECFGAYAAFAQRMGKDFMLEASRNGHDIFQTVCFEKYIRPMMDEAFSSHTFSTPIERREMMEEDILIICRSIVLLWCSSGENWDFSGDLHAVLTRVLRRFLHDKNSA